MQRHVWNVLAGLLLIGLLSLCTLAQPPSSNPQDEVARIYRIALKAYNGAYVGNVKDGHGHADYRFHTSTRSRGHWETLYLEDVNGGSLVSGDVVRLYSFRNYPVVSGREVHMTEDNRGTQPSGGYNREFLIVSASHFDDWFNEGQDAFQPGDPLHDGQKVVITHISGGKPGTTVLLADQLSGDRRYVNWMKYRYQDSHFEMTFIP